MRRFLIITICLMVFVSLAQAQQKTKEPTKEARTKLEAFQAKTGSVLVKNYSEIGTLIGNGAMTVTSWEFVDPQTGIKEYGISIEIKEGGTLGREDRAYIDYDEIGSLLAGIDYILKVNKDQSKLKNFEAHYKTKDDLDVGTFSNGDKIEAVVSVDRIGKVSYFLSIKKLQDFRKLIVDAKAALDTAKS